jgi:hypothetical protein
VTLNWVPIYNRLFSLIDRQGESYYSGGRFIGKVHEVDPYFPHYGQYMETRRESGKSTSRNDYFYDILLELPEGSRMRVISSILDDVQHAHPDLVSEIRGLITGPAQAPTASVPSFAWGADRLNGYLSDIDASIAARQYERAVGLAYTCLEGFYGAFYRQKHPGQTAPNEILALSRAVREWLRSAIAEYPDEALNLTNHISHAVDRARNRFSEAHFAAEAGRWLAIYVRDLVNTQIRLLLHFMSDEHPA